MKQKQKQIYQIYDTVPCTQNQTKLIIDQFVQNFQAFLATYNHRCQTHKKPYTLLCIDQNCQHKSIICTSCLTINGKHKGHDAQQIIQFIQKNIQSTKNPSKNTSSSSSNQKNQNIDEVEDLIKRIVIVYDGLLKNLFQFVENINSIIKKYIQERNKLHEIRLQDIRNNNSLKNKLKQIVQCKFSTIDQAYRKILSLQSRFEQNYNNDSGLSMTSSSFFNMKGNDKIKNYEKAQEYLNDVSYQHNFIQKQLKKLQSKINQTLLIKQSTPIVLHYQPTFNNPKILQFQQFIYIGQCKNGKPNGKGIIGYKNNNRKIIHGQFNNGKADGLAQLYYQTGDYYIGEFKSDRKNGRGIHRWMQSIDKKDDTKQCNMYQGEFKNGRREGKGTFWWSDGSKYVGQFKEGNQTGYGVLYRMKNVKEYEGYWKDGLFNGFGIQYFNNGQIYEGGFKDDKFHGEGVFRKDGEDIYGVWEDNVLVVVKNTLKN